MLILTIIAFLFILTFSVTIHELGHFLFAKLFKIPVEKFSIGFGPPLLRKKIGETDFRIAYLPFGGYVKMAGEEDEEIIPRKLRSTEKAEEERARETTFPAPNFYDVPIQRRIFVVSSGPLFNLVSAVIVLFSVYLIFGIYVNPYLKVIVKRDSPAENFGFLDGDSLITLNGKKLTSWNEFEDLCQMNKNKKIKLTLKRDDKIMEKEVIVEDSMGLNPYIPPIIGNVKINGPAYRAGIRPKDRILKIDSALINTWDEFVNKVRGSKNIPLHFVWQQESDIKEAKITPLPYYDPVLKDTIGQIGVMMALERKRISLTQCFIIAINRTAEIIWLTLKTIYELIIGKISRKALGGPIAIAQLSGESAKWGFENLLGLLSIISINLGLVNLFPIPGLDGGHIIIAMIESIRKKRFTRKTRMIIQQIGYTILLLLIIYVTFNDLTR